MSEMSEEKRLVWDLPLRLFHWLFALSILTSWATAKAGFDWMEVHMKLGYWTIGLLAKGEHARNCTLGGLIPAWLA